MMSKDIDWNEIWKIRLSESFKNRDKNDESDKELACSCYWDSVESARDYLKNYGLDGDNSEGRLSLLDDIRLNRDSSVLEIGPGPGVFTIPFAERAGDVTAIEPAKGMFKVLQERITVRNLENVTLINKRWEDIDPASLKDEYDIVFASFSLGMMDIREALLKMSSGCRGDVILVWHADIPQFETLYSMVWPSLYGREYVSGPKSDILFNILYQLKKYPSVKYQEFYKYQTFPSYEDLMDYFRYQHYLDINRNNEEFSRYLKMYVSEKNGEYIHKERLPCMIFSWPGDKNSASSPTLSDSRGEKM